MTDNEQVLKMLSTALEMEEKGRAFYQKAVKDAANEVAGKIFEQLGADELVHTERIKKIYAQLEGGGAWNDDWAAMAPKHGALTVVFRKLAKEHCKNLKDTKSDVAALDVGIDFETKSVSFYEQHRAKAKDPKEKAFVEKMVEEEKDHHAALVDMKFFLTDPEGWYNDHEHSGLEG